MIQVLTRQTATRTTVTAPLTSSWLTECISRHFPAGTAPDPVPFRAVLEGRLADPRGARGKRHSLSSLVSVLVAGVAGAHYGPLAVAQAAAGWDQEVLAEHGCRISPRTGLRVPPSASTLDRLPEMLDADELEAALSGALAALALDPAIPAAYAAHQAELQRERKRSRRSGSGSRRPRRASARRRRTAGSGRTRCTPGSIPP
jgi:hypothetical protein